MGTVSAASVAADDESIEGLPEVVLEALGELAGAAKEGLLALSVGVRLGVLHELMEAEVDEVVGPKGRRIADRTAVRHGHEDGEVTLGGRRAPVSRPQARSADGARELELASYAHFAARDRLTDAMFERMLAGVSMRRYARTGEPVGSEIDEIARSTSKSAVSREFVSRTREHLIELVSRPLGDLRLALPMLDGIELKGRCCVVALGIRHRPTSTAPHQRLPRPSDHGINHLAPDVAKPAAGTPGKLVDEQPPKASGEPAKGADIEHRVRPRAAAPTPTQSAAPSHNTRAYQTNAWFPPMDDDRGTSPARPADSVHGATVAGCGDLDITPLG